MSTLSIYLPPFSPDYSGAASALYELGGMIILHDASGCTGNVLGYDEPRWVEAASSRALVYCSAYRHLEAILGQDDLVVDRIVRAAESLKPKFIALIGSPVPMLVGTDYEGIAKELEAKTGIPSFGFDTKGLDFYDKGYQKATIDLIKRYAKKKETISGTVNLIGLTPIDFGAMGNDKAILSLLKEAGISVLCSFSMNFSLEDVRQSGNAALNVVLSEGGYGVACYMKESFGIPFITSVPFGDGKDFLDEIRNALALRSVKKPYNTLKEGKKVLIIGEQVASSSLRDILEKRGVKADVAIPFNYREELLKDKDYPFVTEKDIRRIVNEGSYTDIVADPLIKSLITRENVNFHANPTVAISSKFHWDEIRCLIGRKMEDFIEEICS